ncbi:hypothetical protein FOL47_007493 [Perkinsus chesapeaki]|uniref:Uncharacterized protein n=1 Tax=Perkinsus chesapeaki TaxID=330153 RepID=A0A7J6LK51_PERCH|nr:hypothetical protein FOL47_007493 [Perkinsus chesapeaki]
MLGILHNQREASGKRTLRQKAQRYELQIRKMVTKAGAAGITVFDWDDTLFPTVDLLSRQNIAEDFQEQLQELSLVVKRLLKCCLRVGPVVIVTNSEKGWVEYSAQTYCPTLTKVLRQCRIISARSAYEEQYPEDRYPDASSLWKFLAFSVLLREFKPSQLISIGDSVKERQACLKVTAASSPDCLPKSVKLVGAPSIGTLIRELTVLGTVFEVLQPREPVAELARNYLLENPSKQPVHGNTELVRKEVAFVGDCPDARSSMLMLPAISIRGNNSMDSSSRGSSSKVWHSASSAPTSKCSEEVSPSASTAVSSSLCDRS